MDIEINSDRLHLSSFKMSDAEDLFACITPKITEFMSWEPPQSFDKFKARRAAQLEENDPNDFFFVVRLKITGECLGATALEDAASLSPEIGLWLKEQSHGKGYGKEIIASIVRWGGDYLGAISFIYPVAEQNIASRRLAESLGGIIIDQRSNPKYSFVVYSIPKDLVL